MIDPVLFHCLRRLRAGVYGPFGARRDALFDLLDAATDAGLLPSLAHLSLTAGHRRRWGSLYDALAVGAMAARRRCAISWGAGPSTMGSRSLYWTPASGLVTMPRPVRSGGTTT